MRDFTDLTLANSLCFSRCVHQGNSFSKARVGQGVANVLFTSIFLKGIVYQKVDWIHGFVKTRVV